jgi:hypothetical protein
MEGLSNESKEESQNKLVMAILKLLKSLFGKNGNENDNSYNLSDLNSDNNNLPNSLKGNKIAEKAIDIHRDVLALINDFSEKNKAELSSAVSENRLSDVSKLVRGGLVDNINIYLDSLQMDDSILSDPLRRVPKYRQDIIDNINSVFSDDFSDSLELRGIVNNSIDSKIGIPAISHNEHIGKSPREDYSLDVSDEVRNEMMAENLTVVTSS